MTDQQTSAVIMGASSGIGAATAKRLAEAGHHVHLMARRGDELQAMAGELGGSWTAVDATDALAVERAIDEAAGKLPPIKVAMYAAGVLDVAAVQDHPLEIWDRTINVNLNGAFYFSRALTPHLNAGARIVFLSSVHGAKGQPNLSAYGASKGAINRFAESLGAELEPRGIGVHVVAPGPVATPLLDRPGTSPFQLDADQVADVIAWLTQIPGDVVLREVVVRAAMSGPYARRREVTELTAADG